VFSKGAVLVSCAVCGLIPSAISLRTAATEHFSQQQLLLLLTSCLKCTRLLVVQWQHVIADGLLMID